MSFIIDPYRFGGGFTITDPGTALSVGGSTSPTFLCPLSAATGVVYGTDGTGINAYVVSVDASNNVTAGTVATPETSTDFSYYSKQPHGIRLSDTSGMLLYQQLGGSYELKVVAFTVSGTTLTFGTPVSITTSQFDGAELAALSSSAAVLAYDNGSTTHAVVLSVSGTTITVNTAVNSTLDVNPRVCALSSTKFIVASRTGKNAIVGNISGTTITFPGSALTITSSTVSNQWRIREIDSSKAFVAWEDDSGNTIKGRIISEASNVLTLEGSETTLMSSVTSAYGFDMDKLSSTRFIVSTLKNVASNQKTAKVIGVSGTSIDTASGNTFTRAASYGGNFTQVCALSQTCALINYSSGGEKVSALKIT